MAIKMVLLKWANNPYLQNWFKEEESILSDFLKKRQNRIETVLDVGCGTGRTIDFLIKNFQFSQICGIEKNPDLVNYLKQKYSQYDNVEIGWTNILFPEKSYTKIYDKYDLVLCMGNTLGTMLNWKQGLNRIFERTNKYLFVSVYDNKKSIEVRKKVYEYLGFKIKNIGSKSIILNDGFKIRGFEKEEFYNKNTLKITPKKILETSLGFILFYSFDE